MLYEDSGVVGCYVISVGKWLPVLKSLRMLVTSYQSAWRNVPKGANLKQHCCENDRSHTVCFICV